VKFLLSKGGFIMKPCSSNCWVIYHVFPAVHGSSIDGLMPIYW
jgi:hypothetical protein